MGFPTYSVEVAIGKGGFSYREMCGVEEDAYVKELHARHFVKRPEARLSVPDEVVVRCPSGKVYAITANGITGG